jgi:hypothetical protein
VTPELPSIRGMQIRCRILVSNFVRFPIQNVFSELWFLDFCPPTHRVGPNGVGGYMRGGLSACWASHSASPPNLGVHYRALGWPGRGPGPSVGYLAGAFSVCWVGWPRNWRNCRVGSSPSRGALKNTERVIGDPGHRVSGAG